MELNWLYSGIRSVYAHANSGRVYVILKNTVGSGYALEYWVSGNEPLMLDYQGPVAQDSDIFVLFKFAQEMENTCITTESSSKEIPTSCK